MRNRLRVDHKRVYSLVELSVADHTFASSVAFLDDDEMAPTAMSDQVNGGAYPLGLELSHHYRRIVAQKGVR